MSDTPEELKAIMASMGYEESSYIFDPRNNAEQREKVLLWLINNLWNFWYAESAGEYVFEYIYPAKKTGAANKDYIEALMQAAKIQVKDE